MPILDRRPGGRGDDHELAELLEQRVDDLAVEAVSGLLPLQVAEFDGPVGFRFIELSEYLENLLERKVDLLTADGLRGIRVPRVARSIEENIVYV